MADVYTYLRIGEKDSIFSPEYTPDDGTLTFVSGTVSLYSSAGAIAAAIENVAVTNFDSGAQTAPQAWYDIDLTSAGITLAHGDYVLVFTMIDSNGKDRISTVGIDVKTPYGP